MRCICCSSSCKLKWYCIYFPRHFQSWKKQLCTVLCKVKKLKKKIPMSKHNVKAQSFKGFQKVGHLKCLIHRMFVGSLILIVICNFFQYTVNVLLCWLIVSADISFSSSRNVFKHSSNSSFKYENKKRRLHLEIGKNSTFFSSDIYIVLYVLE